MNGAEPATGDQAEATIAQRPRVCFVALHALPTIDPALARPVGGTETRAWTFARGLAQSGRCDVSFIVRTDGPRARFQQAGVDVIPRVDRLYSLYESVGKCIERSPRFPGVRLRSWAWPLLWKAPVLGACRLLAAGSRNPWQADRLYMSEPADLFCTFGVQANSARVIASAHATGRKAVLLIGSDGDLDERYQPESNYISPYGDVAEVCHRIHQRADRIVVQTAEQQRLLAERFGRAGAVIANPIDLAAWDRRRTAPLPDEFTGGWDRYALWVGRAESLHKRPETLLRVAQLCPTVDFLMILNPRDRAVEQHVRETCPPNVRIVSQVPHDLMPAVFERAAVFVSTSALEGFPNVFLQAAATGVPIASLNVSGAWIRAANCGECAAGNVRRLAQYVLSVWEDPSSANLPVGAGRAFVAAEHDLPTQSARLFKVLESVLAVKGAHG
ncbi:MAG: glycosyltransferase family 4 protein [Planctomycetaceae bacterium]